MLASRRRITPRAFTSHISLPSLRYHGPASSCPSYGKRTPQHAPLPGGEQAQYASHITSRSVTAKEKLPRSETKKAL
jgi:hypothetical protein